jgi:hypothetical protein
LSAPTGRARGERLPLACAALCALCAGVAGLARLGALPAALAGPAAAPILFFGAAFPLLLRWSPAEPAPLKLLLFGALTAPFVLGGLYAAGRAAGLGSDAPGAALLAVAFLQALALGRPVAFEPLGKAAWSAALLALCAGGALAWLLLGAGSAPRFLHDGALWHAGVAQVFVRGGALENPWMAGEPLPGHPGHAWLVSVFARALDTPVTRAQVGVAVWALASVPLSIYLCAAPLWRAPLRAALAPLLALVGWNAGAGLGALGRPVGNWAQALAHATPGAAPGQVLYGGAAFFQLGPAGPALALSVAAWTAAAHALRHGARPWVGLCALLHGAACALAPVVGAAALACTLLVALAHPGRPAVRARVPLALLACVLPGLALLRLYGLGGAPVRATYGLLGPAALLPGAALALACVGLVRGLRGGPEDRRGRHTLLLACAVGATLPCALPWVWDAARVDAPALLRLASFALAILAAGGLGNLLEPPRAVRALGVLGLGVLLACAARVGRHAWTAHREFARLSAAASDAGGVIAPASAQHDLREAYAYLRAVDDPRAVLVRAPDAAGEHSRALLAPHIAPLYADLPLWVDRDAAWSPESERWTLRHERAQELFANHEDWDPYMRAELEAAGRPLYLLVTEDDRRASHRGGPSNQPRGVDDRVAKLGARPVFTLPLARVYLFDAGARP